MISFVKADSGWFTPTILSFSTGGNTGGYLNMAFTVGTGESGFWVDVYNPSTETIPLKLQFVSQINTNDGMGNRSCDMVSGTFLGTYLTGNNTSLSVLPDQTIRTRIDFNFPACATGWYLGCAIQTSPTELNMGDMDLYLGKVNFIDFLVAPSPSCMPFNIKIFPGSRPGGDYSNIGELKFYDLNRQLVITGIVNTNNIGSGNFQEYVSAGNYYVVYKGQSHLASYLSGVIVPDGGELNLDFTTGSNLYNVQNKNLSQDDGYRYQIAGDMRNTIGVYDFIVNGNDISSIVYGSGFVEGGISVLDPKNLNGDVSINGADIAIIGINFQLTDPFLDSIEFIW